MPSCSILACPHDKVSLMLWDVSMSKAGRGALVIGGVRWCCKGGVRATKLPRNRRLPSWLVSDFSIIANPALT